MARSANRSIPSTIASSSGGARSHGLVPGKGSAASPGTVTMQTATAARANEIAMTLQVDEVM